MTKITQPYHKTSIYAPSTSHKAPEPLNVWSALGLMVNRVVEPDCTNPMGASTTDPPSSDERVVFMKAPLP